MARKPNYSFEKRQKEMERQKKKEERKQRKLEKKKSLGENAEGTFLDDSK